MRIHRLIYVVVLVFSITFHALYPFWFSRYLMVTIILIIPFDWFISIPGMCTKRLTVTAPQILDQGTPGALSFTVHQKRNFPAGRIRAILLITCDEYQTRRRIRCGPEGGSGIELDIDTVHSGIAVFEIKRINIATLLELFSIPVRINSRVTTLIMPQPIKPPRVVMLPRGVILHPKHGGGFSEESDLRPYRQGDPVRIIHWKLSAKHDSLIIREPLSKPPHSRLVQIAKWNGADERDIILGRLRWVSDYLLKWEMPYYLKFGNDGPIAEIFCTGDLASYLYHLLDKKKMPSLKEPVNMPGRFSWVFRIDAKKAGKEEKTQ